MLELLERFEASENPNPHDKSTVKDNRTCDTRSNITCQEAQKCQTSASNKSILQTSNQQKDRTLLSKNINKILIQDKIKVIISINILIFKQTSII